MPINDQLLTSTISSLQARLTAPDAATLAQATAIWDTLALKVSTLMGQNGGSLILGRSLDRVRPHYPWLPPTKDAQFSALHACYRQQPIVEALAANHALLDAYIRLLATLIGAGLTVQFLRSAFADDSAAPN